ncbi:hypothetical protein ED733_004290 [Metarhizium rileyi]|uniref:Uncharacterized protein n=1 Tax=Metarhizium rileyi (strain RCEF 4871) TaxID=1649241 RepID=A0A5C6GAV2_METRR|nr:hypothetical protein ED733_004290 [Metarhizium rileyi]
MTRWSFLCCLAKASRTGLDVTRERHAVELILADQRREVYEPQSLESRNWPPLQAPTSLGEACRERTVVSILRSWRAMQRFWRRVMVRHTSGNGRPFDMAHLKNVDSPGLTVGGEDPRYLQPGTGGHLKGFGLLQRNGLAGLDDGLVESDVSVGSAVEQD